MIARLGITSAILALLAGLPAMALEITDILGRRIVLDRPAQRIVLGEGRYLETLAILEPDNPARRVVGMSGGIGGLDPALLRQLRARWPEIDRIAIFGREGAESVSAEKIVTLEPDVAIFGTQDHGPNASSTELRRQLEASGTKIVFIDFRQDPLKNTARSIEILGQVLGAEQRAAEFVAFYEARKRRVAERVAALPAAARPAVFLQAHVGRMECCVGMARGMLGPMVGFAGGRNVSAEVLDVPTGRHTLEFLLSRRIDVFVGTASGLPGEFEQGRAIIVLGGDVSPALAHASIERALGEPGLRGVDAVAAGRAHAIWHSFYNSPHNLYVIERFAKWFHPKLFTDLDPEATLREQYARFTPFRVEGTFAVSLREGTGE
jgi:iron complex transport system substrate-binding protein